MKLAWILWLSQLLPQPAADSLCLSTTVYLEARDQTLRGQQAVAEVALRRLDSGLWGDSMCEVVTARKQFAPGIVAPGTRLKNADAWSASVNVALGAERNWALPPGQRQEIVPGASHFMAHAIASPSWRNAYQVATIGDHTFLRVQKLKPRAS
jgi:spore germination cell wall hydrolase CwlJ-like protein